MQRIEKYAVIALVLLLVTILAVSLWSQKKGKSPFSFFKKGTDSAEVAQAPTADPNAPTTNALETTATGTEPGPGLAPLGSQGQTPVDPTAAPADWKPGEPWKNRGRVAGAQQPGGGAIGGTANDVIVPQSPASNAPGAFNGQPRTGFVTDGAGAAPQSSAPVAPAANGGSKPAASKPTPAAGPTYVVQSGDTLGEIAARELGSFEKWHDIAALNGNLDPKKLKKGMKIVLPAGAKASKSKADAKPAPAPGGEYVVQKGDTLSGIAQKVLGKASRWNELVALNPSVDADRLIVGSRLRLPKGVAVASNTIAKAERKNRVR
jgi:LysM repeat protein